MSAEAEPAVDAALAIFGEDDLLKPLAESFGRSAADAVAQQGRRWFQKGATNLWNSARDRLSRARRSPRTPRAQAFIEITKHGAAEERPDIREAYENLAARSMTEDEWVHGYEEYAQRLSKLQTGDIAVLRAIHEKTESKRRERSLRFLGLLDLIEQVDVPKIEVMDSVDRLEANGLLIVSLESQDSPGERQRGKWGVKESSNIELDFFSVLPSPRGSVLLEHIADLEPCDQQDDS